MWREVYGDQNAEMMRTIGELRILLQELINVGPDMAQRETVLSKLWWSSDYLNKTVQEALHDARDAQGS